MNPPRIESGKKPGPTVARTRPARERAELEERIDESLEATFPASDPPAWPSAREPDESGDE